jgi:hypothetical protein
MMIRWFKELLLRIKLTITKHTRYSTRNKFGDYYGFKLRGTLSGTEIFVYYKDYKHEIYTVEYLFESPKIVLYKPKDNFTNNLYIYKGFTYEFLFNEVNKHILESL